MDAQVKISELGNGVVDTKSFWPLVAVKNGQVVRLFTDGMFDFNTIKKLSFPDSRFPFLVKLWQLSNGENGMTLHKAILMEAGRTEVEIDEYQYGEGKKIFVEADIIIKENQ